MSLQGNERYDLIWINSDRFTAHKDTVKACVRLIKLFKLNDLLEQLQNKLFDHLIDEDVHAFCTLYFNLI